ncbi:MAG: YhcH/YjgK/YiaL family protein [Bacteroidota bacterium]
MSTRHAFSNKITPPLLAIFPVKVGWQRRANNICQSFFRASEFGKKERLFAVLLLSLVTFSLAAQVESSEWTGRMAKKWFKKKEYLGGLAVKPHDAIDKIQFAKQYHLNKTYWDKAFAFLKETNLQTLTTGRHIIDVDNVYAFVSEAPSKDYDKTAFESHENYIDLQYVITGEENMGRAPVASVKVDKPYNEKTDIAFYTGDGIIYTVKQNCFLLFFPGEAHRPNISPGGNKVVKKVVIKIKLSRE